MRTVVFHLDDNDSIEECIAKEEYTTWQSHKPPGDLKGDLDWCINELMTMINEGYSTCPEGEVLEYCENMRYTHKLIDLTMAR